MSIAHPQLNDPPLTITQCVVTNVTQWEQSSSEEGVFCRTISFLQYRAPLPILVKPFEGPPGNPLAITPPVDPEVMQIKANADQIANLRYDGDLDARVAEATSIAKELIPLGTRKSLLGLAFLCVHETHELYFQVLFSNGSERRDPWVLRAHERCSRPEVRHLPDTSSPSSSWRTMICAWSQWRYQRPRKVVLNEPTESNLICDIELHRNNDRDPLCADIIAETGIKAGTFYSVLSDLIRCGLVYIDRPLIGISAIGAAAICGPDTDYRSSLFALRRRFAAELVALPVGTKREILLRGELALVDAQLLEMGNTPAACELAAE